MQGAVQGAGRNGWAAWQTGRQAVTTDGHSILRRMIGGATPADDAPPLRAGGIIRAWPLALARAARDGLGQGAQAGSADLSTRSLAEVIELAPDLPLVAMLEGAGDDLGVLFLSQPVMAALIEAQTTGRITPAAPDPRKPTRTDAAMVAGFVDRVLGALDAALAEEDDLIWAGGYRYASFLDEVRPLGLILEDQPFKVLRIDLSFGDGARSGPLVLALPADSARRRAGQRRPPPAEAAPAGAQANPPAAVLGDRVLGVEAVVQAVLTRRRMRLADVLALAVDQVIPLPEASLAEIEVQGLNGVTLARGRLGQTRGLRAVRLEAAATTASAAEARPSRAPPAEAGADALPHLHSARRSTDMPGRTGTGG